MIAIIPQENLDRQQAETALRRTEDLYRRAIRAADAVPYSYDYRTKSYIFMDEGIKQLIGYTAQEITPSLWDQIIQESVMGGEAAGLTREEAVRRVIKGEIRIWRCDTRVLTRAGLSRWISDISVDDFDESGRFTGSVGILQDITERKKSEALLSAFSTLGLRLSAARTVREAAQIIADTSDRLLGWDCCMLFIYLPEKDIVVNILNFDLIDGQRKEIDPSDLVGSPSQMVRKTLNEGGQLLLKSDLTQMIPGGAPFGDTTRPSASLMYVPIRNGVSVIGFLSIQSYTPNAYNRQSLEELQALADHCGGALNRIWTEEALQKAQEDLRQSQKLDAIGQLAGGIAHDFNNLLAVIRGNVDLVLMETAGLSGEVTECMGQISEASERAANLTRQLLTFSRKQIMQSQPLNLDDVIRNLTKMLERIIGEDVVLRCQYTPALPMVQADIGMLEQVLVNLVVNACDAMPDGGELFISTEEAAFGDQRDPVHPEARAGDFVCITVKDTGAGIAPENLPRIFDPFFTTKDVGKGTGLGLSTVYGIVKQHKGWIEVSSQIGVGTAFKTFLPALEAASLPAKARTPEIELPRGTETILLVEDEESVRTITRIVLERSGYRVLEAASGFEALKLWETVASEVDLLLTDVIMPEGVNGTKLASDLHKRKPSLKVIFQSGYGGEVIGEMHEFLRQTKSYFLQKPCSRKDMLRAVRRCLDGVPPQGEQFPGDA